jgi:hypothetical protein
VCVEPYDRTAALDGLPLQPVEDPPREPEAPGGGMDPHMPDLAHTRFQPPQRPAPHGAAFLVRDQEGTRVPRHLVRLYEGGGIEPFLKTEQE